MAVQTQGRGGPESPWRAREGVMLSVQKVCSLNGEKGHLPWKSFVVIVSFKW